MPGTSGVYPVKKVTWHVAKNEDQPVSRFQIPLVPGLSSTIHVAQGTEMFPIIKLDETITPTQGGGVDYTFVFFIRMLCDSVGWRGPAVRPGRFRLGTRGWTG